MKTVTLIAHETYGHGHTTPVEQLKVVAQVALEYHMRNAYSDDPAVAGSWTEPYKRSDAWLKASIGVAYPDLNPEDVYNVWLDCGEDLEYCATWIREHPEDRIPT